MTIIYANVNLPQINLLTPTSTWFTTQHSLYCRPQLWGFDDLHQCSAV